MVGERLMGIKRRIVEQVTSCDGCGRERTELRTYINKEADSEPDWINTFAVSHEPDEHGYVVYCKDSPECLTKAIEADSGYRYG